MGVYVKRYWLKIFVLKDRRIMSLPNLHFEKGRTIIWMYGAWLSLVERVVRDYEVASSNLVAPMNEL